MFKIRLDSEYASGVCGVFRFFAIVIGLLLVLAVALNDALISADKSNFIHLMHFVPYLTLTVLCLNVDAARQGAWLQPLYDASLWLLVVMLSGVCFWRLV